MESSEENSECLWENKSFVSSVSSKSKNCSWGMFFCFFPGVEYRSKFTLECSLKLSIVCLHTSVDKTHFCYMWLVVLIIHFTHETLLNCQSINFLMLWIRLAIAFDFSWPHIRLHYTGSTTFRVVNTPEIRSYFYITQLHIFEARFYSF